MFNKTNFQGAYLVTDRLIRAAAKNYKMVWDGATSCAFVSSAYELQNGDVIAVRLDYVQSRTTVRNMKPRQAWTLNGAKTTAKAVKGLIAADFD